MKLLSNFLFFAAASAENSGCSLRRPRWETTLLGQEGFPYAETSLTSGKQLLLTNSIVGVHDAMRICQAVCG